MKNLLACIVGIATVLTVSAEEIEVQMTVSEPIGTARPSETVWGGIPFPARKYHDVSQFSLWLDGKEVPVQVSPIVLYSDNSLHWGLVSFPVSLEANSFKKFILRDKPCTVKPQNPVSVVEKGTIVEISNGLISFGINKTDFNGFEFINWHGQPVFKSAKAGLMANGQGGACKLIHFEYRYKGPVTTTLYLKGRYGDQKAPTWSMSITLNANEEVIRISHNLRNAHNEASKISVTDPQICLGLATQFEAGEEGKPSGKSPAFGWKRFKGKPEVLIFMRHGGRGNAGVYETLIENNELVIKLNPSAEPVNMAEGEHKITELALAFANTMSVEALSEPLHALASCDWYSEHDGMGVGLYWGSLEDEKLTYKQAGWTKFDDPKKMPNEKPNNNLYHGWFDAHSTSECDHLQGLVFGYLRTGQRGFLDWAHSWAKYWRSYLVWRSDEFIYGKDGKFNTPKWGTGRLCSEGCHFYGVGIFNYALITGDIDSLEGAFDWAEMCNVLWYGPYAGKKPGDDFSAYGSRGFSRGYLCVARAYDVARNKQYLDLLLHYAKMATRTHARDPRGFCIGWSLSNVSNARRSAEKSAPLAIELFEKEGVQVIENGKKCKHPKYGEYRPKSVGTWPEAMESMANYVAYQTLSQADDPEAQLVAEDVMDYAIAEAYLGAKYAFNPIQKAVYYYMFIDFPIPDFIPIWNGGEWSKYKPSGTDSSYTKWWPNTLAAGYRLTGKKFLKDTMLEVIWWGLSRNFVNPPRVPQGEAPIYSRVERNTKGDWMTPTCLAFGLASQPKKEEAPPKPITDLKANVTGGGKVELRWTAPADEGGGKVVKYQVKWAEKPLCDYLEPGEEYRKHFQNGVLTVAYWNIANNVLGEPIPGTPGKIEKMTLTVPAGKTLYFGVRSFDDSHNRSDLSNVVEVEVK